MPGIVNGRIYGMEEVKKRLDDYLPKRKKAVYRKALYAGAVMIRDEARRNAPVRHGYLKRQIVARIGSRQVGGAPTAWVGIAKGAWVAVEGKTRRKKVTKGIGKISGRHINPRRYAHLREFGTRYSRKHPFMIPAVDKMKDRAFDAIAKSLREQMGF